MDFVCTSVLFYHNQEKIHDAQLVIQVVFCYMSLLHSMFMATYRLIHRQLQDDVEASVERVEIPPTEKGILL